MAVSDSVWRAMTLQAVFWTGFLSSSRVYFKKSLELHILGMLQSITCLTGGSKDVYQQYI
jgi:hypothetical protein